jgi:hypothetical protein
MGTLGVFYNQPRLFRYPTPSIQRLQQQASSDNFLKKVTAFEPLEISMKYVFHFADPAEWK